MQGLTCLGHAVDLMHKIKAKEQVFAIALFYKHTTISAVAVSELWYC